MMPRISITCAARHLSRNAPLLSLSYFMPSPVPTCPPNLSFPLSSRINFFLLCSFFFSFIAIFFCS